MHLRIDDGVDLYVRRLGAGPPLIILHGGLGLDHTSVLPWFEPLTDEYTLIAYDHRGNGRSTWPADWGSVDDRTWTEDIERVRETLGLVRPILFASSYGANLALQYALRYGDRVGGLILCGGSAGTDHDAITMENVASAATPEQMEMLGLVYDPEGETPTPAAMREAVLKLLPLYFHGPVPDRARRAFEETHYSPGAFRRSYLGCRPSYQVLDRLPEITVPTLVLQGAHDRITPSRLCGERLAGAIPGAELALFEQSGHFAFMEEPDAVLEVVRLWLSRVAQKPGTSLATPP